MTEPRNRAQETRQQTERAASTWKPANDLPDKAFAEKLVKENKIAVIPMSAFYHNGTDHKVIRLCFAKEKQTLAAAAECLLQAQ
mgnify:CR=1 FL=1